MLVNTPISIGELIDKISILIIKKKTISETEELEERIKSLRCSVFDLGENIRELSVMDHADYQSGQRCRAP